MKTVTERILIIIGIMVLFISVYFYPSFINKFISFDVVLLHHNPIFQWLIGFVLMLVTWVVINSITHSFIYIFVPSLLFIRYGVFMTWPRFQIYKVEIKNGTYENCK